MSRSGPAIVLASSSSYRAGLLRRIVPAFECVAAAVDEAPLDGEAPSATAIRLAAAKAETVAALHPGSLVIGSDQVAELDGRPLGKPGSLARARAQLAACSGREVLFHTAVCLADARQGCVLHHACDLTRVAFRTLDDDAIGRYLAKDTPLDCAGSFKVESLGIALFERVDCTDPTALVGLPLVSLCRLLRAAGIAVP